MEEYKNGGLIILISLGPLAVVAFFVYQLIKSRKMKLDAPPGFKSLDDEKLFDPETGMYFTLEEAESGRIIFPDELRTLSPDVPEDYKSPEVRTYLKLKELGFNLLPESQDQDDFVSEMISSNFGLIEDEKVFWSEVYSDSNTNFMVGNVQYSTTEYIDWEHAEPQLIGFKHVEQNLKAFHMPISSFLHHSKVDKSKFSDFYWLDKSIISFGENLIVVRIKMVTNPEYVEELISFFEWVCSRPMN